ncbi:AKA7G protein, partial [Polypterus senegalus]
MMISKEKVLKKALISAEKLHLTILVANLKNEDDVKRASCALLQCRGQVEEILKGRLPQMTFHGIGHFHSKVLYVKMTDTEQPTLHEVSEAVKRSFENLDIDISGSKEFKPHLTILKLSKVPALKKRRLKAALYKEYEEVAFGTELFNRIDLCSMHKKEASGAYVCNGSLLLDFSSNTSVDATSDSVQTSTLHASTAEVTDTTNQLDLNGKELLDTSDEDLKVVNSFSPYCTTAENEDSPEKAKAVGSRVHDVKNKNTDSEGVVSETDDAENKSLCCASNGSSSKVEIERKMDNEDIINPDSFSVSNEFLAKVEAMDSKVDDAENKNWDSLCSISFDSLARTEVNERKVVNAEDTNLDSLCSVSDLSLSKGETGEKIHEAQELGSLCLVSCELHSNVEVDVSKVDNAEGVKCDSCSVSDKSLAKEDVIESRIDKENENLDHSCSVLHQSPSKAETDDKKIDNAVKLESLCSVSCDSHSKLELDGRNVNEAKHKNLEYKESILHGSLAKVELHDKNVDDAGNL